MRVLWSLDHSLESASRRMDLQFGVTRPQRLVVRLIAHFPGISAGELAALKQVHRSNMTGVLRRLEKRGFVRRKRDPNDLRRALFWLTEKGRRVSDMRSGTVEGAVEETLARVSPEAIAGARQTLVALTKSLQEQARDA
jgi:DNA-binding MarR family transcriptional regulator